MRRNVLIILGVAALTWGVLAIVLNSPSLRLSSSSRHSTAATSPACLPATLERSAKLPGSEVDVSPAPGSAAASPATQVSFLGAAPAAIRVVSVIGSRSGPHAGHLSAYSQGDGASFTPTRPFATGETVTVRATIGAGAAKPLSFQFQIDTPYPTGTVAEFHNPQAVPADYQSFYTLPGDQAPLMTVTVPDRDPAAGDIFTTNGPGPGQYGPLIYSPQGRLIWFGKLSGGEAAENLSVQTYKGQRVLTWWKGRVLSLGFGQGEDILMSSRYQTLARIPGGNGLKADLHELQIAPHNIAYITAYNPIRCDLTTVKGSRGGAIVDTAIQELDLGSGLVRWEWHSLDHIAAAESEVQTPSDSTPWDYFHLNSIDADSHGNLLISARSTWAVYRLDGASGLVRWRLGGNRSSFKMAPGTTMAWQHDARMLPDGDITIFDDGSNPPIHHESRALRIRLDLNTHTARLVSSLVHHNPPLLAASQGNMQTLPGGNTLVGYGGVPAISEYAPDGSLRFDAHQPYDMSFYRAYRFPWSAQPASAPALLASLNNTAEETIVHASWNGATDVAAWRVLAGGQRGSLSVKATVGAEDFESSTTLPERYDYVAAQALDRSGRVLGSSAVTKTISYAAALPKASQTR